MTSLAAFADDLCLRITLKLQIGLVAEDIYDLDIDLVINQFLLQRTLQVRLMPHADDGDPLHGLAGILLFPLFIGLIRQVGNQFLEIGFGGDPVDGHDLHHPAIQLSVPNVAGREGLDLQG